MGKEYSAEVKAAVMSALMQGQSIGSVAKEYQIPKTTVSRWKNNGVPLDSTQKNAEIGDLLLEYLRENLKALRAQAIQFQDREWLKKQSADSVAVLHGVMTDKAVRLLEAMSKNVSNDNQT